MTERRSETVRDVGEFGLIERLAAMLPVQGRLKIGDDAVALPVGSDLVLATVDACVEGTHFVRESADPETLGRRVMASNVSDIAAMGGSPVAALVALQLPPATEVTWLEQLYQGLMQQGAPDGVEIVGGNITRTSGPLAIDVTLLGRVPPDELVTRAGAEPGHLLAVTGTLGTVAAARLLVAHDASTHHPDLLRAAQAAAERRSRVSFARRAAQRHLIRAMIDLSDGLAGDARHLAAASTVGLEVELECLPIGPVTRAVADLLELDVAELALRGGEDYELLLAAPEKVLSQLGELPGSDGVTVIGRVTGAETGLMLIGAETLPRPLAEGGWRHF